jgi:NAD(P)-dependent dehydrogenase (short-subunit alcohol dehydrogenase family)
VLVTGAGGALGRASCLRLAAAGARLAAVDLVEPALAETVRQVRDASGEIEPFVADVGDEAAVRAAVDGAAERFDGLDVLFPNAGIMPHQDRALVDGDPALWETIWRTNVLGVSFVVRSGVPHLERAGGGVIVLMGSFLAEVGCSSPQDFYSATKGAVHALTRALAVELGPKGIRVNAVAPGPVLTAHVEQFFPDPEARAVRLARVPLGRFGVPDDVAGPVCFLASDEAAWMTGQVLVLDGGISVNYV